MKKVTFKKQNLRVQGSSADSNFRKTRFLKFLTQKIGSKKYKIAEKVKVTLCRRRTETTTSWSKNDVVISYSEAFLRIFSLRKNQRTNFLKILIWRFP